MADKALSVKQTCQQLGIAKSTLSINHAKIMNDNIQNGRGTGSNSTNKQIVHLYIPYNGELQYATSIALGFKGNPEFIEAAAQKLSAAVKAMDPEKIKAIYLERKSIGIQVGDGCRLKWPRPQAQGVVGDADAFDKR